MEVIRSLSEFNELIRAQYSTGTTAHVLYRGHSHPDYVNVPTIMRGIDSVDSAIKLEKAIDDIFLEKLDNGELEGLNIRTIPILPIGEEDRFLSTWYRVIQERHLGLPSRLLDWSMNRETALFFAANGHPDLDGHVWILVLPTPWATSDNQDFLDRLRNSIHYISAGDNAQRVINNINPFDPDRYVFSHFPGFIGDLINNQAERRRTLQGGKFIAFDNTGLDQPLDESILGNLMTKIIIPADAKETILEELRDINVTEDRLITPIPQEGAEAILRIQEEAKERLKNN